MARDPYAELHPGQKIAGLPSAPWNQMLRGLKPKAGPGGDGRATTSVEIDIQNKTGSPVGRFAVLKVADPTITFASDQAQFFDRDLMKGETPAAGSAFAITLRPLSADEIGPARLLGLCRVKVNLTDTAHRYADCTTVTTKLTSAATGPARILWTEDNFTAGDNKWAVVLLLGGAVATATYVRFTLPSALATTDASKAACTVDGYWGGPDPGATVTVFNLPASTNYIFSGASGHKGLATYDDANAMYWIVQMECP